MSRLASIFPLPNYKDPSSKVLNNYIAINRNVDTRDTYNVKGDVNLTQKDTLTLRYSKQLSEKDRSGWIPGSWIGGKGLLNGNNAGINETHIFTPNLVNEVRIGWNYINDGNSPLNTTPIDELAEIPGGYRKDGFPTASFRNIGSTKAVRPLTTLPNPYVVWQNSMQYMENLTWHKGKHTIKFGADFTHQRNSVGGGAPPGGYKFSIDGYATVQSVGKVISKRPDNLTGTAEGLLGYVDTLTTYNYGDKTRLHQNAWSAFVADEWRLTRKLNVSLGLRYEFSPSWLNEGDLTANFDLDAGKILVPDTTKNYVQNIVGLPGAVLPANYQYVSPSSVYPHDDHIDFAPRIGFAYSITPTVVFRANYGLFYAPSVVLSMNNQTGAPFSYQLQVIGDTANPVKITKGFPTGGHLTNSLPVRSPRSTINITTTLPSSRSSEPTSSFCRSRTPSSRWATKATTRTAWTRATSSTFLHPPMDLSKTGVPIPTLQKEPGPSITANLTSMPSKRRFVREASMGSPYRAASPYNIATVRTESPILTTTAIPMAAWPPTTAHSG